MSMFLLKQRFDRYIGKFTQGTSYSNYFQKLLGIALNAPKCTNKVYFNELNRHLTTSIALFMVS